MFPVVTLFFSIFLLYSLIKSLRRYLAKPNFKNQTVWITGASSGIGQYLAYQFNRSEASIIISARNVKELERVRLACVNPNQVKIVQLDMGDFEQIQKVTKDVIKQLEQNNKKLDILVQNAGVSMRCLFKDYSFSNHLNMFNINVHGPFRHIQCALDHMIKNKSGHIVGVTSVSAKLSTSHRSSYSGSKSAFCGIMDSLRSQLYTYGIKVTNILPGYVNTNLSKNAFASGQGQKLGFTDKNIQNGMKPTDFSRQAVQAIYNKENQLQISGLFSIPIAIFMRNLCPDLLFLFMQRNSKNQAQALQKNN